MPINCKYGWAPDLPDHRDHLYTAPQTVLAQLPAKADLRSGCPPVYDQGSINSCTGQAIAAAIEFDQRKQGLPAFSPSRLFIYYNERVVEKTVNSDPGAQIRNGVKSIASLGVCPETDWPYDHTQLTNKPAPQCYTAATNCLAVGYQRLNPRSLNQLKGCIASGYPFVFGFTCYEAFESPEVGKSGVLNMPAPTEKVTGGHAVLAVGYDDDAQRFTVRNSWGPDWGAEGYFTMPYSYLTNSDLADDFWTIRIIKE